jgi:hypothetical protein
MLSTYPPPQKQNWFMAIAQQKCHLNLLSIHFLSLAQPQNKCFSLIFQILAKSRGKYLIS